MTDGDAVIGTIRATRIVGPGREFLIDDEPVDIHIADGLIADIAPTGALPSRGEVLDVEGAWAVPGLWDNHVHTVRLSRVDRIIDKKDSLALGFQFFDIEDLVF